MKLLLSPRLRAGLAALALSLRFASAQDSAHEQAQSYFEDDKATEATALLAEAAAKDPANGLLGAMLYASVRDHVWHPPQIAPYALGGEISALNFSANGQFLAAGSTNGEVVVIPVESGAPKRLAIHVGGSVIGLAFNKDATRLAIAGKIGGLRIWDLAADQPVYETPAPAPELRWFATSESGDLAAVGTADGTIQALDLAAGKMLAAISVPGGEITALAISRSGRKVAAGGKDRRAHVWDSATGEAAGAGVAHQGAIRSLDFSYDDRYVLSGGDDSAAWLSNPEESVAVLPAMACGAKIKKVLASHGGSTFATLLEDDSVLFWDAFTGKKSPSILNEHGQLNDFAWSYTGLRSVTVSEKGEATLWNIRNASRRGETMRHAAPVRLVVTSPPASKFVATGTADGKVRIWRTDSGRPLPTVRSHAARARTAFYSVDGQHLVTASDDRTALHWLSGRLRPFGLAMKHEGAVTCAVFDLPEKRILTGDQTGAAQLWDAATGKPDGAPFKHDAAVHWVNIHADGKRLVTASGRSAFVWNADDRTKPLATITHGEGKTGDLNCARFSPDGKWLITGSADGSVRLWDATTYQPVGPKIEREFAVLRVRFSPDSSRFVVAGEDAQAAVFEVGTWKPIGVPVLTTGPIFSASFTDDGKFLVVASLLLDTVRFYEVETGRALGDGVEVGSQALSVDHNLADRVVVVACEDGTVRAFETPFVNQDVPAWFPPFVERLIGLRKTGPDEFQPVISDLAAIKAAIPPGAAADKEDFPRLAQWKLTTDNTRHGMPRFVSTLAQNIEQRVEERSVEALFECYEAIAVDPLVLSALSLYLPNRRQGEYIADLSLALPDATPLSRCFAAGTLIKVGRSQEAEAIATKALADAPNDLRVLRRVAKLQARFSHKPEAIRLFEKAVALEPDNAETHRAYGWALYNFQEPAKAAAQFQLAQDYAGETVEDLIAGLCLCSAAAGDTANAQASFKRLVVLEPQWQEAAYLSALTGWTQYEVQALENIRRVLFPTK